MPRRQAAERQAKSRLAIKPRNGDPRFLEQLQKCLAASRALLGLDAEGERRKEVRRRGKAPLTLAGIL